MWTEQQPLSGCRLIGQRDGWTDTSPTHRRLEQKVASNKKISGRYLECIILLTYCDCVWGQIPCDVMVSVKLPAAPQGPTVRVGGKQAAVTAVADTPVFDVTPARCTIQPGSHVFTTVTFSPLALQANTIRHTQPQSLSVSVSCLCYYPAGQSRLHHRHFLTTCSAGIHHQTHTASVSVCLCLLSLVLSSQAVTSSPPSLSHYSLCRQTPLDTHSLSLCLCVLSLLLSSRAVTSSPPSLSHHSLCRQTLPDTHSLSLCLSLSLVSVIIQPGSHVFTTVTFSPLALQANTIRHTPPQSLSLSLSVVSVIIQPGSHVFMTVGSKPVNQG